MGTVQRMLLVCMADGESRTVRRAAEDMLLGDSQARGAMDRLYRRNLVRPDRFEHYGREWVVTAAGIAAYHALFPCEDEEELDHLAE